MSLPRASFLPTIILSSTLAFLATGRGNSALYSYADGEYKQDIITLTENSSFHVPAGTATQGGYVIRSQDVTLSKTGAGTLILASWNSLNDVDLREGTTIMNSTDGSYFTSLSVDGNGATTPSLQIDGSRLGGYELHVGTHYKGDLRITNGGSYSYTNAAVIAYFANTKGSVLVSGAGSVLHADGLQMVVGRMGEGSLTLSDGGMITSANSARSIHLGEQLSGRGVINIGAASGAQAGAPGIIHLNQVSGGAGGGVIVFNHNSNDYFLTQDGTSTGTAMWVRDNLAFRIENGTTTLRDINTNTGDTTVIGGTLLIRPVAAPYSALGTGKLTVGRDGTFGGNGVIKGAATISGTLSPGNSAGQLSFEGGLALESTARILMEIGGYARGGDYDAIDVTGILALDGALHVDFINDFIPEVGDSFTLFGGAHTRSGDFNSPVTFSNGYLGTFNPQNGSVSVTAVPEPSSLPLLLIGAGTVCFRSRRGARGSHRC